MTDLEIGVPSIASASTKVKQFCFQRKIHTKSYNHSGHRAWFIHFENPDKFKNLPDILRHFIDIITINEQLSENESKLILCCRCGNVSWNEIEFYKNYSSKNTMSGIQKHNMICFCLEKCQILLNMIYLAYIFK